MSQATTLVWLRRDLRMTDNTALQTAIRRGLPVAAAYVFDTNPSGEADGGRRTGFILDSLAGLHGAMAQKGIPLWVCRGRPETEIPALAGRLNAAAVVCAEDYDPDGIGRDNRIWRTLDADGRALLRVTDRAVFAKADLMSQHGRPYTAFAPYQEAWLQAYAARFAAWQPDDDWASLSRIQTALPDAARRTPPLPSRADLGITSRPAPLLGGETAAQQQLARFTGRIGSYALTRDFPAKQGTSALSPYLSFGLLSPRRLAALAWHSGSGGAAWLAQLIRREFFMQILFHFPHVLREDFRNGYRNGAWENRPDRLERWQHGQTGYPLIDAAMRCLLATGMLHPCLRTAAACFLTRNLLADWRHGERWFAAQLLDYDPAANCGNWQQAAGSGFGSPAGLHTANPVLLSQKYDPDGHFIRRHVPELAHLGKDTIHAPWLAKNSINTHGYPDPVTDYAEQSKKAAAMFQPPQGGAV